jgi:hypothetical protein
MRIPAAFICVILFCNLSFGVARRQAGGGSSAGTAMPSTASHSDRQGMSADQVQALRDDLNRMKALVQQMETNLTFVDTTQSPLKHQFQLEIDMWRMMIRQMERRLGPDEKSNSSH